MAIDLLIIGAISTAACLITLLLVFVFSPKEVSYEEAVKRQQILSPSAESVKSTAKSDRKVNVNKKDKSHKRPGAVKKKRETVTNGLSDELDSDVPIFTVDAPNEPSPSTDSVDKGTHDHVGFKGENLIIEFDRESLPERKRRVSTDEKPKKPILLNKTPEPATPNSHLEESKSRTNSFDTMHPKDEYELLKNSSLRKSPESLANDGRVSAGHVNGHHMTAAEASSSSHFATLQASPITRETVDVKNRKQEKGKGKQKVAPLTSLETLTTDKLLETIRSLALDSNEITLLVNELLNKQGEGESSWSVKNDPIAPLKKALTEKEEKLHIEMANSEAANARVKELRSELSNERSKTSKAASALAICQSELNTLKSTLNQISEKHRSELSSKTKLTLDQKATINQLQDEIVSYKETMKKLEAERESIARLQIELDAARQAAAASEMRLPSLQAAHDELLQENLHLKDVITSVQATQQQDSAAAKNLQQKVNDLKSQLTLIESKAKASHDELNQARNRIGELQNDSRIARDALIEQENNMKSSSTKAQSEINSLKERINELSKELDSSKVKQADLSKQLNENIENTRKQLENNDKEVELQSLLVKANEQVDQLKKQLDEESRAAAQDVDSLTSELKKVSDDKCCLEKKLTEVETRLNKLIEETNGFYSSLSNAYPSVSERISNNGSLAQLVSELVSQAEVNASTQQSNEQLEALGHELQDEKDKTRQLLDDVNSLKSSLEKTSEALQAIEQKANQEQDAWSQKLSNLSDENCKLKSEKETLLNSKDDSNETINKLNSSITSIKSQLEDLEKQLSDERKSKQELTTQLDEVSR